MARWVALLALCVAQARASALRSIGIVGAGPAGLAQAIAIRQIVGEDVRVRVFDRSDQLRPELGGGVQLNSGAAVLARLGLGAELKASGRPAARVLARNVDGATLLSLDLHGALRADSRSADAGMVDGAGDVLALTLMRDELQRILGAQLPPDVLALEQEVVDVKAVDGGRAVEIQLAGGGSEAFDLVIGADGIRSMVRQRVAGPLAAVAAGPSYTGIRIRWGIAPGGSRAPGAEGALHQWFGEGAYCLAASYGGLGGKTYDQCVVVSADEGAGGTDAVGINAAWERSDAVRAAMGQQLQAARMPAELLDLAGACGRCFELGSYLHNPLLPWVGLGGRAVLVGDAAHAMPPFLGQGTNQAMQDAYCLAQQLKKLADGAHGSLEDALRAYESARKLPNARLALNSRVLGFVETGLPDSARDAFFRTTGALGIAKAVFLDGALPKV